MLEQQVPQVMAAPVEWAALVVQAVRRGQFQMFLAPQGQGVEVLEGPVGLVGQGRTEMLAEAVEAALGLRMMVAQAQLEQLTSQTLMLARAEQRQDFVCNLRVLIHYQRALAALPLRRGAVQDCDLVNLCGLEMR